MRSGQAELELIPRQGIDLDPDERDPYTRAFLTVAATFAELEAEIKCENSRNGIAATGEFFHVPAGIVHRNVNPSDDEQDYVLWLTGYEPRVVHIDEPSNED